MKLYHGTSSIYLDDILRKGLDNPFLTDLEEKAEYYAQVTVEAVGGEEIVLEVYINNISELRIDLAELNEPVVISGMPSWIEVRDNIRKAYNKYAKKHPERYQAKYGIVNIDPHDYSFSLNLVNSVRVEGYISPGDIKIF